MYSKIRKLMFVVTVIAVVLGMVACGQAVTPTTAPVTQAPGQVQPATQPATLPATQPATTQPAAERTLLVWDVWTGSADTVTVDKIDSEFMAAHPGVKIERVAKGFDDMKATAKLGLSSADGPDVAQINQGLSDMGALVKAGLLENLTPLAQQYGWDKKVSAGIMARNSFTADGKLFGQGNLYGIAPTAELVGVYYRKDKFQQYGLSIPKTFADFENILKTLKDKGEIPIVAGNMGGLASTHWYAELLNLYLPDRIYLDNLIYGRNNESWDTPEQQEAAAKLQEWVKDGYFTPGFEGISYDDQQGLFEAGKGVLLFAGSWYGSGLSAGPLKDELGFFLLPPITEGAFKMTVGGTSLAYAIRATSTNKDLAAEYIDWMLSDQSAKIWADSGTVPMAPIDPSVLPTGSMFYDLVTSWITINQKDEVGHYLDWATPTFYDTLTSNLESLMGMQETPQQFTQKLQADYSTYLIR